MKRIKYNIDIILEFQNTGFNCIIWRSSSNLIIGRHMFWICTGADELRVRAVRVTAGNLVILFSG